MKAILKRELSSYFASPIAYIVLSVFFAFSGLFFVATSIEESTSTLAYAFSNSFTVVIFIIPLITMKSFSEEKRQKTDQALLTAPVSLFEIVFAKFLGAFILYAMCCSIFMLYSFVIGFHGTAEWAVNICTTIGLLLLGGALIAINIFISALTESQVVAAVVGLAVGLIIWLFNTLTSMISIEWIATALENISFTKYYANFTYGLLDIPGTIFFLSIIALFVFLTMTQLNKKRWS